MLRCRGQGLRAQRQSRWIYKDLLNSHDAGYNILVCPGDVVTVNRAGIVYVLGDVKKPGGFLLRNNETVTVLQALALAGGLAPTSARSQARILRTDETGQRTEIPLDLAKIMQGKTRDAQLQPKDIVFVDPIVSFSLDKQQKRERALMGIVPAINGIGIPVISTVASQTDFRQTIAQGRQNKPGQSMSD